MAVAFFYFMADNKHILIPLAAAALVLWDATKSTAETPPPPPPPPGGDAIRTARQIRFLKLLTSVIQDYNNRDSSGRFGEMGFVRFDAAYSGYPPSRRYYAPDDNRFNCPDNGEHVALGNYTDLENFLICITNISNRPADWNYSDLSFSDRRAIIRNYFSQKDLIDNWGPNGPHSTYLDAVWYDVINSIGFIIKVVNFIIDHVFNGGNKPDGQPQSTDASGADTTNYTDPNNWA